MAWAYLTVADLFEIGWAIGLKYSDGFSKPVPSLITVAAMAKKSSCHKVWACTP
jgi:quaternary ammonium compound-resistance protein SugE